MSQWWESLETDPGEPDYDAHDQADDELEDDPSTWDLTTGRASEEHRIWQPIENLDRRELLTFVIDGVQSDGTDAPHDARAIAAAVLRKRDPRLWEAVLVAYTGKHADGSPAADWSVKKKALEKIEAARLDRAESWKDPRTGEIAFATGDPRSADERLIVRTPPSTRKVSSGPGRNQASRRCVVSPPRGDHRSCAERCDHSRVSFSPAGQTRAPTIFAGSV